MKILVLDAMGVIYSSGDDVKELLYPFIIEKGGTKDFALVEQEYHLASLGKISAIEFWKTVGISSQLEDEYLQRFELTNGLINFLEKVKSRGIEIWCLSNDLSEWSKKLRVRFGLDQYFKGFVISGDVGVRKPDPFIYQQLINQAKAEANNMIFVDDRIKNLEPASTLGFTTVLFTYTLEKADIRHLMVSTFMDILPLLD